MKKRVLAFLGACLLAVSTVSGCSSDAGTAGTATGAEHGSTQALSNQGGEDTEAAGAAEGDSTTAEAAGTAQGDSTTTPAAGTEEAAASGAAGVDISVMKPWVNSNIKGVVTDDVTADLKDDFYLAVNHDWLRDTEFQPGRPSATPWYQALDTVKERCFDILADESLKGLGGSAGHDAELIQNYYHQYLDWESRNEDGLEPIMPVVEALRAVETLEDLQSFLLSDTYDRFSTPDAPPLVPLKLNNYAQDSDLYQVDILPTQLLLEDSAEYKSLTANGERVKKQKEALASYMLGRIGMTEDEAQKAIDNVNRLDAALAEHEKSTEDMNGPSYIQESVNPVTMDGDQAVVPGCGRYL